MPWSQNQDHCTTGFLSFYVKRNKIESQNNKKLLLSLIRNSMGRKRKDNRISIARFFFCEFLQYVSTTAYLAFGWDKVFPLRLYIPNWKLSLRVTNFRYNHQAQRILNAKHSPVRRIQIFFCGPTSHFLHFAPSIC